MLAARGSRFEGKRILFDTARNSGRTNSGQFFAALQHRENHVAFLHLIMFPCLALNARYLSFKGMVMKTTLTMIASFFVLLALSSDVTAQDPPKIPNCTQVSSSSPSRHGQCIIPATPGACQAHSGAIYTLIPPSATPYFNAKDYVAFPYYRCIDIAVKNVTCSAGAGANVVCKQWDGYSSFSPLGPICNAGTMVGTDNLKIDECTD